MRLMQPAKHPELFAVAIVALGHCCRADSLVGRWQTETNRWSASGHSNKVEAVEGIEFFEDHSFKITEIMVSDAKRWTNVAYTGPYTLPVTNHHKQPEPPPAPPPPPPEARTHKPPPAAPGPGLVPTPFAGPGFVITGISVAGDQATIGFAGNGTNAAQAQVAADLSGKKRRGKGKPKAVSWKDVGSSSLISPLVVPTYGAPSAFYRLRMVQLQNTPPQPCGPPPLVQILSPASGATVSDVFTFTATAVDRCGITNVEFFVDNFGSWLLQSSQAGAGVSNIYTTSVDSKSVANGAHNTLFRAYNEGGVSSYTINSITVTNYNADPGVQRSFTDIAASVDVSSSGEPSSIKFDSKGNGVIAGKFQGRINVSGTAMTSMGGYDIWLQKVSTSGSLQWAKNWGGPYDQAASSVAIAPDDTIWVVGQSTGTLNLGGTNIVSGGGNNNPDPFIGHFTANGDHMLSWRFGGPNGNYANGVTVDASGNIYVCGTFSGVCDFGGGQVSASGGAGFVASWSASGVLRWSAIQDGDGYDAASFVALDASGNVYVAGDTGSSSINFGHGPVPNGTNSMWLAKYTPSGSNVWARVLVPNGNSNSGGLAVAPESSVMFAGSVLGTLSVDGQTVNAPDSSALMVSRFDGTGGLLWLRQFGGISSVGGQIASRSLCVDASGNVITSGTASGEANFGDGQLSSGTGSMFVQKLSPSGGYLWHRRAGGSGYCGGTGVATDAARNVGQVGYFNGSLTLDGVTLSSPSGQTEDGWLRISSP